MTTTSGARRFAAAYAVGAVVFLALDAVWLTLMAPLMYRPMIGHLMRDDFDVLAALGFYVIYLGGMVFFAVLPAARMRAAASRGALFGLVCYATYDLTNQATLRGWPWLVTFADLAWGAFVTATACTLAYLAMRRFVSRG